MPDFSNTLLDIVPEVDDEVLDSVDSDEQQQSLNKWWGTGYHPDEDESGGTGFGYSRELDDEITSYVSWTHRLSLPNLLNRFRFRGSADGNSDHLLADDFTMGGGGARLGGGYDYADNYQYEQVLAQQVTIGRD